MLRTEVDVTARDRFNLMLLAVWGLVWLVLAIEPVDREAWLLENMLVFVSVPVLLRGYWLLPLSRISYTLLAVFFCLHAIGSHYTYSLVPYDPFWIEVFGESINETLGFERNHYDRLVHFCFGLLLAYPCREVFIRIAGARGFWAYFLPVILMMSLSVVYEFIEWGAAVAFGGELGVHYLGTQGDEWDAHMDMALASLGAAIAMLVVLVSNRILQRDFAAEWAESCRVKDSQPLGEESASDMLRDRVVPGAGTPPGALNGDDQHRAR